MHPNPNQSRRRGAGYTLIEVVVAIGILALAIGAASQLSLSQNLTEDVNQRESMAVNYGENAARLWQLGIDDPASLMLTHRNFDGTAMTATVVIGTNVSGAEDFTYNTVEAVPAATVNVVWKSHAQSGGAGTTLSFPVLR